MKIVWILAIVVVIVIAAVVAVPYFLGHSSSLLGHNPSCGYITSSEAASLIGGTWSLNESGSYCFTVNNNGTATVKYFNGTTVVVSLGALGNELQMPLSGYAPESGMVEMLNGNFSGESSKLDAFYITFSSSSMASNFFTYAKMEISYSGAQMENVSNNVVVAYLPMANYVPNSNYYWSIILELNGNTVYMVSAYAPTALSTSTLENLVGYL